MKQTMRIRKANLNAKATCHSFRPPVLLWVILMLASQSFSSPGETWGKDVQPGDVFKEYAFKVPNVWAFKGTQEITIDDLKDAIKAELHPEYWGGHIGTSEQRLIINGNTSKPVYYPLPKNTKGRPECYYRQIRGATPYEFPVSLLKEGKNTFEFKHSKQICYSFDWPNTLTYGLTFRVYYKSTKPHPTGTITDPVAGSTIGYKHKFKISAKENGSPIKRVDYIGYYEDLDWQGNGLYTQWHYYHVGGMWVPGVGRSDRSPYTATWTNSYIPDQPGPIKFMARIMAKDGTCYMTPAVENVTLKRPFGVKMFKPSQVPENFAVRVGNKKGCNIDFGKSDPTKADVIKVYISTWSATGPAGEPGTTIYLDGTKFLQKWGSFHAPSWDRLNVDKKFFTSGRGTMKFEIHSDTHEHACEINWPGPIMYARYGDPSGIDEDEAPLLHQQQIQVPNLYRMAERVQYTIPGSVPYEVRFVNLHGQIIHSLSGQGPALGEMDIARYPAGVYLARILTESQAATKRIVIVK